MAGGKYLCTTYPTFFWLVFVLEQGIPKNHMFLVVHPECLLYARGGPKKVVKVGRTHAGAAETLGLMMIQKVGRKWD